MILRALMSVALLALAATVVTLTSDIPTILQDIARLSVWTIGLALACLVAGCLLAAWRLKLIASDLGFTLSYREAAAALSIGQITGSVVFQIVGQLAGRGWLLSQKDVPLAATVILTGYERLIALAVSLILAGSGALYLFGEITFSLDAGGSSLVRLAVGLTCATLAGAWLGFGRESLQSLIEKKISMRSVARIAVLSLAIQIATLCAYVALAHAIDFSIPLPSLVAAASIVMLSASLPISLGGWGVREISAIVVLGVVGLSKAAALTVAVMIGGGSLLVVGVLALATLDGALRRNPLSAISSSGVDYSALLSTILPIIAAIAVLFQVFLPTSGGMVNVNLADPVAILAGALFAISYIKQRDLPVWRVPSLNLHILTMTIIVAVSFLIGAYRFGFTPWASTNRFLGWFILIAFACTGAMIVKHSGEYGLQMLLRTFAAAPAGIVLLEAAATTAAIAGFTISPQIRIYVSEGFSQNRNAFAFQILIALSATFYAFPRSTMKTFIVAVLLVGLWLAGSRAGAFTLVLLCSLAVWLKMISFRQIFCSLLVAGAICLFIIGPVFLPDVGMQGINPHALARFNAPESGSVSERLYSMMGGWRLFLEHPIFGAGLGRFMYDEVTVNGRPLVIHSTPIWLLAETGLIGFLVFLVCIVVTAREALRDRSPAAATCLVVLAVMLSMSLVHDMLYQRTFWLIIGAALAFTTAGVSNAKYCSESDDRSITMRD
jgi:O-antigen ligase/uncharacterized membrane protein YbhN (UPF0104 family)